MFFFLRSNHFTGPIVIGPATLRTETIVTEEMQISEGFIILEIDIVTLHEILQKKNSHI